MVVTATLRQAAADDWPRILDLLTAAGLPVDDLEPTAVVNFTVAADGGNVVGAVAVERYGAHGLLRSLVVDPDWRGHGLGRALTAAAEQVAAESRLDSLTLLTQTAAPLFRALGYQDLSRTQVPSQLLASAEFSHLCPSTSDCLTKSLKV